MKRRVAFTLLRAVFITLGGILVLNAAAVSVTSNFNLGILFTFLLGGLFLACGIFFELLLKKLKPLVWCVLACALAAAVAFSSFILIYGKTDSVTYNEDAVIVLGAGIHGERVSRALRLRLDAAVEYHQKNPNALIVVSGGQGPEEDITEALAMERYLVGQGVPKESIIKEERSTSTAENFEFSKEILDNSLGEGYSVAYVTSDFHIFRAGRIARKAGMGELSHLHGSTDWYLLTPNCLRESVAVVYYFLIGAI